MKVRQINRNQEQDRDSYDFSKLRVGNRNLDDVLLSSVSTFKSVGNQFGQKKYILNALANREYNTLAEISNFYVETSGIYDRLCKYFSYLYRYDWYVIPYFENEDVNQDKLLKDFSKVLRFYDKSEINKICGDMALKTIINGCFYGCIVPNEESFVFQELPRKYCRTRFKKNNRPVIEFNLKYFDDNFSDIAYRMRVLKSFPEDIIKGYALYKSGKLKGDYNGDSAGWYALDPDYGFKLNCGTNDMPLLVNMVPALIDLNEAQELDRKKMMQQLLKIVIQKLPLDKNNDLVFDLDEAQDLHNNAVQMLKRAINVDVLTTFADIDVADMADKSTSTTRDELEKVERTAFNESGTSHALFNSDSNLALTNSILNDEASVRVLLLQFQELFNRILNLIFNKTKKYYFRFKMLETTVYNYKDMSKLYKEQTQIGFSKMLPQVALGHTQSEIIATATFENKILNLNEIMVPPAMSSTMSGKNQASGDGESKGGRPEKDDSQKSDKTIANKESQ